MQQQIAIVGGGIVGCIIARQILDVFPGAAVTLLERGLAGCGVSLRSAGVHFPIGHTARVRRLSAFSAGYYSELSSRRPELPLYPVEFFAVAPHEMAASLRENFVAAGDIGPPPADRNSPMPWPERAAVWRIPGCHVADVNALVQHLIRGMRDRLSLLEGMAVTAIEERDNGLVVSLATGAALHADKLVLAPGPWINDIPFRRYVATLGVKNKKVVAMHLDCPVDADATAMLFPAEDAFLVPLRYRGHWLFSYTCPEWDVSADQLASVALSPTNIAEARTLLARYAPTLAPRLNSGRVFCDAYSPNREPIVTMVGRTGNMVFAGAANGSGYRLAPGIAAEVAQLLQLRERGSQRCAS